MGNDTDDNREPDAAPSFDWDSPLWNCAAGGSGDSLEPLNFNLQSLKDVDSAAWLSANPTSGTSDSDKKLSPEERFIDSSSPARTKKRKSTEADDEDHPLFAASAGRRKKKPNGMPKCPLSAYNCYFQEERARLMRKGQEANGPNILPSGKIRFEELGKLIGKKWKSLPEAKKKRFHDLASADTDRYHREMEAWRVNHSDGHETPPKTMKPKSPRGPPPVSEIDSAKPEAEVGQAKREEEDKAASEPEMSIFAASEKASEPAMSIFAASEASAAPAEVQSQESFGRGAYSPFPSPSPSSSGSDLNFMAGQGMPQRTVNSATDMGMSAENETPQVHSSYADSTYSRMNEPTGLAPFPVGHHVPFVSHAPQHHRAAPMYQDDTQGDFAGFSSESIGIGAAPGFALAGVPRRVQDPPPNAVPVAPGMEIVIPDQNGVQQKYKVQYACYLVTRDEAKEYVEKFGDCPLHVGPPPVLDNGARPMSGKMFGIGN